MWQRVTKPEQQTASYPCCLCCHICLLLRQQLLHSCVDNRSERSSVFCSGKAESMRFIIHACDSPFTTRAPSLIAISACFSAVNQHVSLLIAISACFSAATSACFFAYRHLSLFLCCYISLFLCLSPSQPVSLLIAISACFSAATSACFSALRSVCTHRSTGGTGQRLARSCTLQTAPN